MQTVANSAPARKTITVKQKQKKMTIKEIKALPELTNDQKLRIELPPAMSLVAFAKGWQSATDWYNVTFRTTTIVEVATVSYDERSVEQAKKALQIMHDIFLEAQTTKIWKFKSNSDFAFVSALFDAYDEVQYKETRLTLVYCYKRARAAIEKFVGKNQIAT